MISDAFVTVNCDVPWRQTSDDVELTALAMQGTYDMSNVQKKLESWGWKLLDGLNGECICPECVEDGK